MWSLKQWLHPPRYVIACSVASFGGFLFGLETGTIGPITAMPQFAASFGKVSSTIHGLIVSSILIPAALSSFLAGHLADKVGRPYGMTIGGLIFGIGTALEAGSVHLAMLFIGRAITGVGEGLFFSTFVVYICEIAPSKERGILASIPQLGITASIFIGYFFCYGTVKLDNSLSWRLPFAFQSLSAVLYGFIAAFFLPHSPRWLKSNGRQEEAEGVAEILGIGDLEEDDRNAHAGSQAEISIDPLELHRTRTTQSVKEKVSMFLRMFAKDVRKRTALGVFLMGMQQFSGIDGVLYYAPLLFQQAGLVSSSSSFLASGLTGTLIFVACIPGTFFADRWSRRMSTAGGGTVLAASMFIIGSLYASGSVHPDSGAARYVVIACIFIFAVVFSGTWAIHLKIYASEIQPAKTRATAFGLAQSMNWVVNWLVAFTTPIFLAHSSSGVYFLFGSFCLLTVIVCILWMPETRGLSLEQIDGAFEKHRVLPEGVAEWRDSLSKAWEK